MSGRRQQALRLLRSAMDDARFDDESYLRWQYDENPVGETVEVDITDEQGATAVHFGGIQQELRRGTTTARFAEIVNLVVAPRSRRQGNYVAQVQENAHRAIALGIVGGYGVTNDASTAPSIGALGGSLIGHVPVRVCSPAASWRDVEVFAATPEFLRSRYFEEVASGLDTHEAAGWTQRWSAAVLRWRLSRPGQRYLIHVGRDIVAVTIATTSRHVPVSVVLKTWARRGVSTPVDAAPVVASAARRHHTPLVIYGGWNEHVRVRGRELPNRLLPSPLNIVFLTLSELDQASFRFATFEFLDFDAF